jgi:hypothetical protein
MGTRERRIERLEKEQQFRTWFAFTRFLEGLSDEQVEDLAIYLRFPEPLPEPLPMGSSRLDGLDRKSLLKLWEQEERETSRIMRENSGRNEDERRFHLYHGHWPEQGCNEQNCLKQRDLQLRHDSRETARTGSRRIHSSPGRGRRSHLGPHPRTADVS